MAKRKPMKLPATRRKPKTYRKKGLSRKARNAGCCNKK